MLSSLTLAAALLCAASPAAAATAETVLHEHTEEGETYYSHDVIYRAAPGEANRLKVTIAAPDEPVVLNDPGAEIEVGGACTKTGPHRAVCPRPVPSSGLARVEADAGDGDDTATLEGGAGMHSINPRLAGGAGHDTLEGGPLVDYLFGGAGDDTIDGGPGGDQIDGGGGRDTMRAGSGHGFDYMDDGDSDGAADADVYVGAAGSIVTYRSRTEPVVVDLKLGTGGAAGENDSFSEIYHVQGGQGGDTLLGGAQGDFLAGGAGDDRIDGRRGDDGIVGDGGADRLRGGHGKDLFHGGSDNARDINHCGRGDDLVGASDARDLLRRSCEDVGWAPAPMHEVHYSEANAITVQPTVGNSARRLYFRSTCRYGLSDCTGTMELRHPRTRRLLGSKRFTVPYEPREPSTRGSIRVRLSDRGQRRIRRGGKVRVIIRSRRKCGGCLNRPKPVSTGFTTYMRQ